MVLIKRIIGGIIIAILIFYIIETIKRDRLEKEHYKDMTVTMTDEGGDADAR